MIIHLKLTIMALLWAGGFIAGKLIAHQAGPFTIAFFRFLVATVVLAALAKKQGRSFKVDSSLIGYSVLAGFMGVFCYNYFFFAGIKFIDASRGSVIISMVPIVVVLISYIVFKEKVSIKKFLGILVSVVGAWVVITKGQIGMIFGESIGRGELYLVAGAVCAATFTLSSKPILKSLSPMVTMVYVSGIGTAFVFIPALIEISQAPVNLHSYSFLTNMLYLAIGPSAIAGLFYYEAIHAVGPSRASQYMNLMPVFAVVLAFIFLGEQLTASLVVGGGLVTTGLYLTNLS